MAAADKLSEQNARSPWNLLSCRRVLSKDASVVMLMDLQHNALCRIFDNEALAIEICSFLLPAQITTWNDVEIKTKKRKYNSNWRWRGGSKVFATGNVLTKEDSAVMWTIKVIKDFDYDSSNDAFTTINLCFGISWDPQQYVAKQTQSMFNSRFAEVGLSNNCSLYAKFEIKDCLKTRCGWNQVYFPEVNCDLLKDKILSFAFNPRQGLFFLCHGEWMKLCDAPSDVKPEEWEEFCPFFYLENYYYNNSGDDYCLKIKPVDLWNEDTEDT